MRNTESVYTKETAPLTRGKIHSKAIEIAYPASSSIASSNDVVSPEQSTGSARRTSKHSHFFSYDSADDEAIEVHVEENKDVSVSGAGKSSGRVSSSSSGYGKNNTTTTSPKGTTGSPKAKQKARPKSAPVGRSSSSNSHTSLNKPQTSPRLATQPRHSPSQNRPYPIKSVLICEPSTM